MITFSWGLAAPPPGPVVTLPPQLEARSRGLGDLALTVSGGQVDLVLVDGDLATDGGLQTSAILSLYTHRRVDEAPAGADRLGWWADALTSGDRLGSRLWTLTGKRSSVELARAEACTREAFAWLLEDRVASRVDVVAGFVAGALTLAVTIHRPDTATPARFSAVWTTEESL